MLIYQIDGLMLVVLEESYVYLIVVLIGDVIFGKGVYVGFNVSLCGDFGCIVVKDGVNIQDNCVMYGFFGQDMVVEEEGYIGYGVILYGCVIGCNVLVGMSVVIIDGVVIGENSIVGVLVFVKVNVEMFVNYLIIGSLVKVICILSEQELVWKK